MKKSQKSIKSNMSNDIADYRDDMSRAPKENPYSAEHPVHPSKFAGRQEQLREFADFMQDTLAGNSKNICVLGEWGIGKTSLLRKMKEIAETNGCIVALIELDETLDSYASVLETITANLAKEAKNRKGLPAKIGEALENLTLSVNYGPVGIAGPRNKAERPNIVRFEEDIESIHGKLKIPMLIMLDNVESIINIKGALFSLRNVFQKLQSMGGVRCMLVLAGRETLFRDIRSVSEPVARFFWGVSLKPFSLADTKEAIEKPLAGTNIVFESKVIDKIHAVSGGHPFFIQVFAYTLFKHRTSNCITMRDYDAQYHGVMKYLGFRLFQSLYLLLSDREKRVVNAIAGHDGNTFTNQQISRLINVKSLNMHLKNLSEKTPQILVREGRGEYRMFHPLFKEYLRTLQKTWRGG
ncbi:MAG: ATP-binding protein [Candidatus Thermoplasmatota archaeon]